MVGLYAYNDHCEPPSFALEPNVYVQSTAGFIRGQYTFGLLWNPKADVDALLTDVFQQAFGPAAAPVRRYYERLDPGNEPLVSEHLLPFSGTLPVSLRVVCDICPYRRRVLKDQSRHQADRSQNALRSPADEDRHQHLVEFKSRFQR